MEGNDAEEKEKDTREGRWKKEDEKKGERMLERRRIEMKR